MERKITSEEVKQRIKLLVSEGRIASDIAKEVELPYGVARRWVRKFEKQARRKQTKTIKLNEAEVAVDKKQNMFTISVPERPVLKKLFLVVGCPSEIAHLIRELEGLSE